MREEKKGKQTSERRKYRENEQKGRPLAAPQSFEMPVRSAAETASISPSAAAAEKENDPDTAVVAAVAASASTAVMSVSAAAAQEQDDPDHVVAASAASSICIMACQTFTLKMKNVAVHSRQKQLLKEKFYMDRT